METGSWVSKLVIGGSVVDGFNKTHLLSTTSVICQIDATCSPFQSLNMRPFHIRLERLQLEHSATRFNINFF